MAVHQASFVLETKNLMDITDTGIERRVKSGISRLRYNRVLLKVAVLRHFNRFTRKMAVLGSFDPNIRIMGPWVWGMGLYFIRK